ncbi:hypothetical protein RE474_00195 [Methanolobus sediminis]|uniref:DUF4129 domain-containing protein n=1 Tax=Methanolobus sediminis TaxID=3072978 RepID=A0AA51ULA0_9EURY|nr:hypothetical protein [Methanolobus sediminis]WMW25173.1 hypothetical protein RE474_00195 [Methanolobus sediminis]
MNRKNITLSLFVMISFLMLVPVVSAKDITFMLPQDEYYFLTGDQAYIPLYMNNSYGTDMNGILQATFTQEMNTGSVHVSSSNSKSTSFQVPAGDSATNLGFGTSNDPETLKVSLTFNYDENGTKAVTLGNILIHFVEDESEIQNNSNPIQSSSQDASLSQSTDPFAQQEQQMQQAMQQLANQQSSMQSSTQTSQQAAQNNQMDQDTSALKSQMEQQIQQQEQMKQEFQQNLTSNEDFQEANQQLEDMGYNLTDVSVNPSTNNTGTFTANYEKQNGDTATLQGEMDNGTVTNLQKDTAEERQNLRDILARNKDYQKYLKELQNDGFAETDSTFSRSGNATDLQIQYGNSANETAQINARFINESVDSVELVRDREQNNYPLYAIGALLILALAYLAYSKYRPKKAEEAPVAVDVAPVKEIFDFRKEAREHVDKAVLLYEEEQIEDAYGTAAQALRLYLSHFYGLKKEVTNAELISHLKVKGKDWKEIETCLELCSLIEFAKHVPEDGEFEKVISTVKKAVNY